MLNGELNKLPDLPSSKNKFWDKADTQINNLEPLVKCEHYFVRKGKEINCRNCPIGFYADENTKVKKGRILYREKYVL